MNEALSAAVVAHPQRLDNLIGAGRTLKPVDTGVVYPLSGDPLMGAAQAGQDGLITPVLIGPANAIPAACAEGGRRPSILEDRRHSRPRGRRSEGLPDRWQGRSPGLHTDARLHAVVQKGGGPEDRVVAQQLR